MTEIEKTNAQAPKFVIGDTYTRDEIHKRVRGNKQGMLPTLGGRVVCCCTRPDIDLLGPTTLLIGNFPRKYSAARQWARDRQDVPVFSKVKVNHWKYIGDYYVRHWTEDPSAVEAAQIQGEDPHVKIILHLAERVPVA